MVPGAPEPIFSARAVDSDGAHAPASDAGACAAAAAAAAASAAAAAAAAASDSRRFFSCWLFFCASNAWFFSTLSASTSSRRCRIVATHSATSSWSALLCSRRAACACCSRVVACHAPCNRSCRAAFSASHSCRALSPSRRIRPSSAESSCARWRHEPAKLFEGDDGEAGPGGRSPAPSSALLQPPCRQSMAVCVWRPVPARFTSGGEWLPGACASLVSATFPRPVLCSRPSAGPGAAAAARFALRPSAPSCCASPSHARGRAARGRDMVASAAQARPVAMAATVTLRADR